MSTRTFLQTPPLKLSMTMPDGSRKRQHPFLWLIENKLGDQPKTALSTHMGVRPQTLYVWIKCCRHDRNFSLPLERAIQIAKFFKVKPELLRPDALNLGA